MERGVLGSYLAQVSTAVVCCVNLVSDKCSCVLGPRAREGLSCILNVWEAAKTWSPTSLGVGLLSACDIVDVVLLASLPLEHAINLPY